MRCSRTSSAKATGSCNTMAVLTPTRATKSWSVFFFVGFLFLNWWGLAQDTFRSDPNVTVLLMSLKCGSLGLNLTCASRVVLVDLWWNPFLEDQARKLAFNTNRSRG